MCIYRDTCSQKHTKKDTNVCKQRGVSRHRQIRIYKLYRRLSGVLRRSIKMKRVPRTAGTTQAAVMYASPFEVLFKKIKFSVLNISKRVIENFHAFIFLFCTMFLSVFGFIFVVCLFVSIEIDAFRGFQFCWRRTNVFRTQVYAALLGIEVD